MIYKSRALDFAFRKPEFNTIYYTYSNELSSKYYISALGGGRGVWGHAYFAYLGGVWVQNLGKPAYIILEHSLDVNKNGVKRTAVKPKKTISKADKIAGQRLDGQIQSAIKQYYVEPLNK